jgi:hypothetical protein
MFASIAGRQPTASKAAPLHPQRADAPACTTARAASGEGGGGCQPSPPSVGPPERGVAQPEPDPAGDRGTASGQPLAHALLAALLHPPLGCLPTPDLPAAVPPAFRPSLISRSLAMQGASIKRSGRGGRAMVSDLVIRAAAHRKHGDAAQLEARRRASAERQTKLAETREQRRRDNEVQRRAEIQARCVCVQRGGSPSCAADWPSIGPSIGPFRVLGFEGSRAFKASGHLQGARFAAPAGWRRGAWRGRRWRSSCRRCRKLLSCVWCGSTSRMATCSLTWAWSRW